MTPEGLKIHVHNAYQQVLGSKKKLILEEVLKVIDTHPKYDFTERIKYKTMVNYMMNAPLVQLIDHMGMLKMLKKYWHYRKAITSKLVPPPGNKDEQHLAASLLAIVLKNFDAKEIDKFYDTLTSILHFAEPHAVEEDWASSKPLLQLDHWLPLSEWQAKYGHKTGHTASTPEPPTKEDGDTQRNDGGSEGGQGGGSGDGVQQHKKEVKGKGKRKRAGTDSAAPTDH